ncbi:MAG: FAD:protein FMN transferase [Thermoanaerobaculia bacterium]|nr:FAD:protein FMN transferase [Thermoanaerobaculia bacterium]
MGTSFEAWLFLGDAGDGSAILDAVFAEIERVDEALSHYKRTSEISRLNLHAGRRAVTTDPEVFGVLQRCRDLSEATGGAFDITIGRLVEAWGFGGGSRRVPTDKELQLAQRNSGFAGLDLEAADRSVRFLLPGLQLDLGSVGKGYALDRAASLVRELGVERALLGAGWSSFVSVGPPPDQDGWPITVSLTRGGAPISTVRLGVGSVSTSSVGGDFFELEGELYGHILDPRSGRPVTGVLEATVLAESGELSDSLSTALMVIGATGGELLADYGAKGLLVTGSENAPRVRSFGWPAPIEGHLEPE